MKLLMHAFIASLVLMLAVLVVGNQTLSPVQAQTEITAREVQFADPPPPVVLPPANDKGFYAPGNTLFLYGDMVVAGGPGVIACKEESRFKPGQGVVFRMTAITPATGEFDESTQLTVHIPVDGGLDLPMRYRGNDAPNPRPGFWTAKWTIPMSAQLGVLRFTVTAKDSHGRTGIWAPFNIQSSMLTIANN